MTVVLKFKEPSFEALFHLGLDTAVILDEKSATSEATIRSAPDPTSSPRGRRARRLRSTSGTDSATRRKIPIAHATFRFISDPSAAVAAMLAGDIDAFPRFANVEALGQFKSDPRFQVLVGGTEGKTILAMNNKKKPLDDVQGAPGDRLCDRPQGDHRRCDGRPWDADRQPSDAQRPGLCRSHRHVSARPEKAKALLKEGGRHDAARTQPDPAACRNYARQSGEIIAAELAEVGINAKIQNVEWAQWLSGVYKDKNYDLTIVSHVEPLDIGHLRQPELLLSIRQPSVPGDLRQGDVRAQSRRLQGGARRSAEEDRRRQRQRLPVPVAERDGRRRQAQGPVEERADLRQRSLGPFVAMSEPAEDGKALTHAAVPDVGAGAARRLPEARVVAGRGDERRSSSASKLSSRISMRPGFTAPERALKEARASEARWASGRADRVRSTACRSRSRTISRPSGDPTPLGTAASEMTPAKADAPPAARLREAGADHLRQDDHARLRHALVGPLELSSARAQSVEARPQSRRLVGRRRRGGGGAATARFTSAPTSAARCVCRRAGAGSSASSRARGRIPIDPPYIGRVAGPMTRSVADARLDDGDARAARCPRLSEPEARETRLGDRAGAAQGPAGRAAAGGGLRRSADAPTSTPRSSARRAISRPRARMSSR